MADWDLSVGAEATRIGIQAIHGGSASRGISAPAGSGGPGNIMLWWRPERGGFFGYVDGWTEAADAFYFSGRSTPGSLDFAITPTQVLE